MVTPAYGSTSPYVVRFTYGVQSASLPGSQPPSSFDSPSQATYKVTGDHDIRPIAIRDDGTRTYIRWDTAQSMPAVFAIDREGHEETVNGYVRGTEFAIDRVFEKLIFRIDRASATAQRVRIKAK